MKLLDIHSQIYEIIVVGKINQALELLEINNISDELIVIFKTMMKISKNEYIDEMMLEHGKDKLDQIERQWLEYSAGN